MVNTRTSILHKVYLQSLLSRRAMTEDVALEMYKRAVKVCEGGSIGFPLFLAAFAPHSEGLTCSPRSALSSDHVSLNERISTVPG